MRYIIVSFAILIVVVIILLHNNTKKEEIFKYVSFCALNKHYGMDIYNRFFLAKKDLNIPNQYDIDHKSDANIVKGILSEFQKSITEDYFNENIPKIKFKKMRINTVEVEQEFLLYKLNEFLYRKVSDPSCRNREIFEYLSSEPVDLFNTKKIYKLTDLGVTYYKLYYITLISVQRNTDFETTRISPSHEISRTEKAIDEKQVIFYQHPN